MSCFNEESCSILKFSVNLNLFRLLTIWFDYGNSPEVYEALVEGIKTIQIDNWLQVGMADAFNYLPIPGHEKNDEGKLAFLICV